MLVLSWRNHLPLHILVMLVMFQGLCGIFWQRRHPFRQKMIVLPVRKIVVIQANHALKRRQMGRESVLSLQQGIILAAL